MYYKQMGYHTHLRSLGFSSFHSHDSLLTWSLEEAPPVNSQQTFIVLQVTGEGTTLMLSRRQTENCINKTDEAHLSGHLSDRCFQEFETYLSLIPLHSDKTKRVVEPWSPVIKHIPLKKKIEKMGSNFFFFFYTV
jgi:hypothetical protein